MWQPVATAHLKNHAMLRQQVANMRGKDFSSTNFRGSDKVEFLKDEMMRNDFAQLESHKALHSSMCMIG